MQSNVSSTSRSSGGCEMETSRPPVRCFRSSMQNIGGCAGFSKLKLVSWMRGWLGEAVSSSFPPPLGPRMERRMVSRSGCWTLSTRQASSCSCSSQRRLSKNTASIGMGLLHRENEQLVDTLQSSGQIQRAEQAFQTGCFRVLLVGGVFGNHMDMRVASALILGKLVFR